MAPMILAGGSLRGVAQMPIERRQRSVRVHFDAHDLVKAAGAHLVSITEPTIGDSTPESFWMEGMMAVNNQYESVRIGLAVKGGLYRTAQAGGSYGGRRLGYIRAIEQLPDGRQEDRHLRRPAAAAQPFYAGLIVYKRGTPDERTFEGRHPALIDRETFARVQTRLDEKRVAGEYPRVRQHYLCGSIFCGDCGQRLTYGISTGKKGRGYPYYFCSARINGTHCTQRANLRPS